MPQNVLKHKVGLETHGLKNLKKIHWNLSTPQLYEHIIANKEGQLSHLGPVCVTTGEHTGLSLIHISEPTRLLSIGDAVVGV